MRFKNLKICFFLVFFNPGCVPNKLNSSFQYTYRLSSSVHFDHKGISEIGVIDVTHSQQKAQKFRHYAHSPHLYLYDKNTEKCYPFPLVLYNPSPEKTDSLFWALLDSATYHHPVPPDKAFSFTTYINLNLLSRNRIWMLKHIKKNSMNMEFHFFNPLTNKKKQQTLSATQANQKTECPLKKPDFKITEIQFTP